MANEMSSGIKRSLKYIKNDCFSLCRLLKKKYRSNLTYFVSRYSWLFLLITIYVKHVYSSPLFEIFRSRFWVNLILNSKFEIIIKYYHIPATINMIIVAGD